MSNCATCYGLIMEPMKSYGYAGKVCNCTPPVYAQRPVCDHDNEREAFERMFSQKNLSGCTGSKFIFATGETVPAWFYHRPDVQFAWEAWQARAAVKLVQDSIKPTCDNAGSVKQDAGSLDVGWNEAGIASPNWLDEGSDVTSTIVSTGNTEERGPSCQFCGQKDGKIVGDEIHYKCGVKNALNVTSNLGEGFAMAITKNKFIEIFCQTEIPHLKGYKADDYYRVYPELAAWAGEHYRALIPRLSDTSAEKARVQGLVEALRGMVARFFYDNDSTPELIAARKAIAAFEGK